ncbi:hypothetical protein LJR034_008066 [Caballeronia sp. LjRoot34]|uniref:hypothetical protein n=1 Tax=Caballeronia sp. LjRoot34 TaxID=3342325 RepID=UPI003ED12EF3
MAGWITLMRASGTNFPDADTTISKPANNTDQQNQHREDHDTAHCPARRGMHRRFNQFKLRRQERKLMFGAGGRVKLMADGPGAAEHCRIAGEQVTHGLQSQEFHGQPSWRDTRCA